ncbi:MAG TPA: GGDEF domain-containing protein [Gaiellaceae bacterium]|nr:GGDEF domain-containing protein [Gaiellaceae bacterium]
MVLAAALHRRILVITAFALYAAVTIAFYLFEVPGLGIGHFYYIPVALMGLALGVWGGIGGGALAACVYSLMIIATPRLPTREVLTAGTVIRTVTYSSCGALIGWFANAHRAHVRRLQALADRDFLTGLPNARVFDESLARRCASGKPFVLVLGDMDNLKDLNNTHGHAEGNRALRQLADALIGVAHPGDELARVGGDEFALLSFGSVDEAQSLCALLRQRLARDGIEISFGWAACPAEATGPLELFRKADDRLLGAKVLGRNRRAVVELATAAAKQ